MSDHYSQSTQCQSCGSAVGPVGGVHFVAGEGEPSRLLCNRCFNEVMSDKLGLDFQHPDFQQVMLADATGTEHTFELSTYLRGEMLTLEATEIRDGMAEGFRFSEIGDAADDPMTLFQTLYTRMRTALSRQHLEDTELGLAIKDLVVRGRVDWDEETGLYPRVIIDGRSISWTELGRMLMSFEGWNFKLELIDPSDPVE